MKMKNVLVIIFIVTMFVVIYSEELIEYKIENTNYNVKIANNWKLVSNSSHKNNVSILILNRDGIKKNNINIIPYLIITVEPINPDYITGDLNKDNEFIWFTRQLAVMAEMSESGKKITNMNVEISNEIIKKTNLNQKYERCGSFCIEFLNKEKKETFSGIQVYFIKDNNLISINVDCKPEIWNDLENEIISIINNSF